MFWFLWKFSGMYKWNFVMGFGTKTELRSLLAYVLDSVGAQKVC
jgi:hypothetical protein